MRSASGCSARPSADSRCPWPREYGGAGLTHAQAAVLREEMAALKCRPPLQSFGIWMLGPALLQYGSEEQKRDTCRRSRAARSAGARATRSRAPAPISRRCATRAEENGDHFVVTGQKIWTSYADEADWIFCLVRTDSAKKHAGISFLLIDMTRPASARKPIQLIRGKSPFCETFFDNVKVPRRQPGRAN